MNQSQNVGKLYHCPMHPEVRQPSPGKCPKCRMDLLPEGTRFGMLRHMLGNPLMVVIMVTVLVAVVRSASVHIVEGATAPLLQPVVALVALTGIVIFMMVVWRNVAIIRG